MARTGEEFASEAVLPWENACSLKPHGFMEVCCFQ